MQTFRLALPEHPDHPGVEQWAELRAPSTMRAGDAKALRKAIRLKANAGGGWDKTFSMGDLDDRADALLVRVIVNWSYELPVPAADPDSLDEIPIDAWETLRDAIEPHQEALDFRNRATTREPTPADSSASRTISGAVIPDPSTSQTTTS
ncbi:hypothetical protein ACIBI3_02365 [Actinomadura luteofluorescens]|uniref:hypothetical protein n=1 Tax=Actinomadura luteofluorescens TaxID=46163 RepID=UPI00346C3D53